MKKGDIVLVTRSVFTKHRVSRQLEDDGYLSIDTLEIIREVGLEDRIVQRGYERHLMRLTHRKPFKGLVVGWSMRISGRYVPGAMNYSFEGGDEYDPGELYDAKYHTVIMVQPIDSERWYHPVPCLEEDLEVVS